MARPFVVIPSRSYRSETQSALAAMRIETEEDSIKAKKVKRLIKKARKMDLDQGTISALYSEYNPYFYLTMTEGEVWFLKEKFREVGLGATYPNISEYGMNFTNCENSVVYGVVDPVATLQNALDSVKERILFTGTVEIEYQDNHEIKFLNVRKSVVTMTDKYPRS
jgi:hypothetical protein